MFERLFGDTVEEQLAYLQPRIILTGVAVVLAVVFGGAGSVLLAVAAYIWAWAFLKGWFGITTIGALLSRNVVMGVIIFLVYLVIGYFIGLVTFLLGLIRYVQLKCTSN